MTQAVALATAVMKEAAERHRETGGGPQYLTQLQVEAEVLQ
jgi:hypothetical protein